MLPPGFRVNEMEWAGRPRQRALIARLAAGRLLSVRFLQNAFVVPAFPGHVQNDWRNSIGGSDRPDCSAAKLTPSERRTRFERDVSDAKRGGRIASEIADSLTNRLSRF
jgi:hypothetical protein